MQHESAATAAAAAAAAAALKTASTQLCSRCGHWVVCCATVQARQQLLQRIAVVSCRLLHDEHAPGETQLHGALPRMQQHCQMHSNSEYTAAMQQMQMLLHTCCISAPGAAVQLLFLIAGSCNMSMHLQKDMIVWCKRSARDQGCSAVLSRVLSQLLGTNQLLGTTR